MLLGTLPLFAAQPTTSPPAGITITPVRGELDLAERAHSLRVVVANGTAIDQGLEISAAELGHTLDGTPIFDPVQDEVMTLGTEGRVTLRPGESRPITIQFRFPDEVAVYKAVVARLVTDDGAAAIDVETQLAAIFLLRGPRPWDQSLRGRDVAISAMGGDRAVVLAVDVENIGDAHVRPTGEFVISLPSGDPVARVPFQGENIIPGYARTLSAEWHLPPGLPDELAIGVELDDGTVVPAEVLAVPKAAAQAAGESPEGGFGGAFFGGDSGGITALHGLASLLLLVCLVLLILVWKRRRDDEDDEVGGAGRSPRGAGAGE